MFGVIAKEHLPLLRRVRELYRPDLPYHHFPHGVSVAISALELCSRCEQFGIVPDRLVVFYTGLLHDVGIGIPEADDFASSEEYASHCSGRVLQEFGVPRAVIIRVQQGILSTHRDASFGSVEEKIVRAADLMGLQGPYPAFLQNTILLKRERELLAGKPCSWEEWKQLTAAHIAFYISQEIHLTPLYRDASGESVFHTRTRKNLEQFLEEAPEVLDLLEP